MKAKKIFMKMLLLTAFFILTNEKVYSQADTLRQKMMNYEDVNPVVTDFMTCDDLEKYLDKNSIACFVDYSLCSECLGVEGDIAFDTTQSVVDNLSTQCTRFFNQVSLCLSRLREKETGLFYKYLNQINKKASLTKNELKSMVNYEQKGLPQYKKLISQLELINSFLIKVNGSLIDKLEKSKDK